MKIIEAILNFLSSFKSQISHGIAFITGRFYQAQKEKAESFYHEKEHLAKEQETIKEIYEATQKIQNDWERRRISHLKLVPADDENKISIDEDSQAYLLSDRE